MAIKKLARKNKAHFYGIYDNEKFIGLIYNIYYKDIVFIFYLAIDKETRGKGYGSKILEFIKQTYTKQRIILCIEQMDKNSNNYKQRKKRKEFYIKNGFKDANYLVKEKGIVHDIDIVHINHYNKHIF